MDKNKKLKSKKEIRLQRAEKVRLKQEKAQERQKLMPLIKAFGLWIVLVLILNIPSLKETFAGFFVDLTVKSVLGLSKLLFLPVVHLGGQNISVNGYNLQIIYECTAYNFYLFVIPLVIFSNWEIKAKLLNMIIFIGAIVIANFSRFIIMGYIGSWMPGAFEAIHDYLWNVVFGILVFAVWLWRDRKANPKPKSIT